MTEQEWREKFNEANKMRLFWEGRAQFLEPIYDSMEKLANDFEQSKTLFLNEMRQTWGDCLKLRAQIERLTSENKSLKNELKQARKTIDKLKAKE